MSPDIYSVPGSVAAVATAMTPHYIAVDTCSAFSIIARASLSLREEQRKVADAHMLRLAAADKLLWTPSDAAWLLV